MCPLPIKLCHAQVFVGLGPLWMKTRNSLNSTCLKTKVPGGTIKNNEKKIFHFLQKVMEKNPTFQKNPRPVFLEIVRALSFLHVGLLVGDYIPRWSKENVRMAMCAADTIWVTQKGYHLHIRLSGGSQRPHSQIGLHWTRPCVNSLRHAQPIYFQEQKYTMSRYYYTIGNGRRGYGFD